MAELSMMTSAICSKVLGEFDKGLASVQGMKGLLRGEVNGLVDTLMGTAWSASGEVTSACNAVQNNLTGIVPDLCSQNIVDDVVNMIQGCGFLRGHGTYGNPLSLLNTLYDSLLDGVWDKVKEYAGFLPEFDTGIDISKYTNFLNKLNLGEDIPYLNQALNCASAICGTDISSRLTALTNLKSDLNLTDGGLLDLDAIYERAKMTSSNILSMNQVKSTLDNVYGAYTSSFSNGVECFKNTDWDQYGLSLF